MESAQDPVGDGNSSVLKLRGLDLLTVDKLKLRKLKVVKRSRVSRKSGGDVDDESLYQVMSTRRWATVKVHTPPSPATS